MQRRLTQKRLSFVLNLFKGLSQREAYIQAGYSAKQKPTTIDAHASDLAKNDMIMTRLEEYRAEAKALTMLEIDERRQILTKIARGELIRRTSRKQALIIGGKVTDEKVIVTMVSDRDPIPAIAELNKMDGVYATAPIQLNDNRQYNLIVRSEKTKKQLEELANASGGE